MSEAKSDLRPHIAQLQSQLSAADAAQMSLCSYWPIAKTVLSMLQALAGSYPTVVTAINALIAAGNTVCPSTEVTKDQVVAQMNQAGVHDLDSMAEYLVRVEGAVRAGNPTDCQVVIGQFIYSKALPFVPVSR
jgi:hypothetical protein